MGIPCPFRQFGSMSRRDADTVNRTLDLGSPCLIRIDVRKLQKIICIQRKQEANRKKKIEASISLPNSELATVFQACTYCTQVENKIGSSNCRILSCPPVFSPPILF